MPVNFDLIVIGTGSAASSPASKCRSSGWEVAVIDSRPFGGTCALRGCDPKKVLVRAAELVDWHARDAEKGLLAPGAPVRLDWPGLIRFKSSFTDPVPESTETRFSEAGIAVFHGRARFVDRNAIQVGDEVLTARHILIASGAKPRPLDIPGEEHVTTSTQFLELEALPRRVVFIGGGYISFEFAHVAAQAGAQVIILHRSDRPLKHFDPDLVDQLVAATREAGVDVRLNTDLKAIEKNGKQLVIRAATERGEETIEADLVVHGAGRVPEIDDLELEKGGVERKRG
ncbi:MAG: NAD(P)/FAD-dependent oxidoreductase, partial [Planctomycetes bacterium]|nr:NAD(P)/FAD-dependent oxidoreductase [Planctomycetota bacterium]